MNFFSRNLSLRDFRDIINSWVSLTSFLLFNYYIQRTTCSFKVFPIIPPTDLELSPLKHFFLKNKWLILVDELYHEFLLLFCPIWFMTKFREYVLGFILWSIDHCRISTSMIEFRFVKNIVIRRKSTLGCRSSRTSSFWFHNNSRKTTFLFDGRKTSHFRNKNIFFAVVAHYYNINIK
jgi:hypothetical protein